MKNTALIIGSHGFLGKHLECKLKLLGFDIGSWNCKEQSSLNMKSSHTKYEYIFHCANYFTPGVSSNKYTDAQKNQELNLQIIDYWKFEQPEAKFITFGSDACYDDIENKTEDKYLVGEPIEDYKDYAWSKRILYSRLKESFVNYPLSFYHFVLITLYGPYFKMEDEHLIHSIIKKIHQAKHTMYIPEFWGDGKQIREITYIDDVIDNVLNIVFQKETKFMNRPVNLGSNISYPIEVLVEEVCKLMNYNFSNVVFNKEKHSGVKKKSLDSTFASKNLPDYKITTLREGLKKTIDYYYLKQRLK